LSNYHSTIHGMEHRVEAEDRPERGQLRPKSFRFDERFQPGQSLVPLPRDEIKVIPDLFNRLRTELKQALSTHPNAMYDSHLLQNSQVFRDRLPRDFGAVGELSDRNPAAVAEPGSPQESGLGTERREYRRLRS